MGYLDILEKGEHRIIEVMQDIILGRGDEADLKLPYSNISRLHCKIKCSGKKTYIFDLNSTNGISVNGKKVNEHELSDRDEIEVGSINIVFYLNEPAGPDNLANFVTNVSSSNCSLGSAGVQEKLEIMFELSKYLNSIHKIGPLMSSFMDAIIKLLLADRGFIMLKNENGKFEPCIQRLMKTELSKKTYSKTACKEAIVNKSSIISTNTQLDERFSNQQSIVSNKISSILVTPILFKNSVIGLIYLDNLDMSKRFNEDDQSFLEAISSQAAIAINNANLYAKLQEEKNMVQNILESMGDGLIVLDKDFNPVMTNLIIKKLFVKSKNHFTVLIDEIKTLNNKDSIIDVVFLKPEFHILACKIKFHCTPKGKRSGVIISIRDVTQLRQEISLKNKFFTLLSNKLYTRVDNIITETSENPESNSNPYFHFFNKLSNDIQTQQYFIQLSSGPLRLSRTKVNLQEFLEASSKQIKKELTTPVQFSIAASLSTVYELDESAIKLMILSLLTSLDDTTPEIQDRAIVDIKSADKGFKIIIEKSESEENIELLLKLAEIKFDVLTFISGNINSDDTEKNFVKISFCHQIAKAHGGYFKFKQLSPSKVQFRIFIPEIHFGKEQ
ncbi:FHA domain-containing protein [bacterium]|nr:FHA domain-containing protein [bacterium]